MMWDFWSKTPESLHQVTILFSDRGTPDGYRHMDGFGSHTYSLIDAEGRRTWVKWHFKTLQGIRNLSADEAVRLSGTDPDYAQRDLFDAIAKGDFPRWSVEIQVMDDATRAAWEAKTGWDAFDLTKVWPQGEFPRIPVGILELNRNPDNYHAHVEQAALSPSNIVPGLGYSPDKMLQARLFAYHDAQLYRVGVNHQQLEVNRPRRPVFNQQRDGAMALSNGGAAPNYDPVHAGGPTAGGFGHGDAGWQVEGVAGRYDTRATDDHFTQPGNLFRLLTDEGKRNLVENIAGSLGTTDAATQDRQIGHFLKADPAYGEGVVKAIQRLRDAQA
jgi:catalase